MQKRRFITPSTWTFSYPILMRAEQGTEEGCSQVKFLNSVAQVVSGSVDYDEWGKKKEGLRTDPPFPYLMMPSHWVWDFVFSTRPAPVSLLLNVKLTVSAQRPTLEEYE
jgi:hypothetical protein